MPASKIAKTATFGFNNSVDPSNLRVRSLFGFYWDPETLDPAKDWRSEWPDGGQGYVQACVVDDVL